MRSQLYRECSAWRSVWRLREYPRTLVRSHSGQVSPPASGDLVPSVPLPELSAHQPPGRPRQPVSGNDGARWRSLRLSPPRGDPAIDCKNHARGIAGAVGGEEGHQVSDFPGVRGTAERQALLEFLVAVLVAELVLGAGLEQRDVAVGADRAGVDADHADIVDQALSPERAGKRHQRCVDGAAADIIGVEFFTGNSDVVDDDAAT